jgi:hypothetical protein
MSGRHKFSNLEAGMPPSRRARIDRLARKLGAAIDRKEANRPERPTKAPERAAQRKPTSKPNANAD